MALPSTGGGARVLAISVSLCFWPVVDVLLLMLLLILVLGCFAVIVVVVFLILNALVMLMFGRQYGALR